MDSKRCLSVEEVLDIRSFLGTTHIGISPTGGHIAYTLALPDDDKPPTEALYREYDRTGRPASAAGGSAWVSNVATREAVRLGREGATTWAPEWSPDGKQIAFYSNEAGLAQLWVWDLATKTSRRVSERVVRPFFGFDGPRWCLDGSKLLAKAVQAGSTVDEANAMQIDRPTNGTLQGQCTAVVYGEAEESQDMVCNRLAVNRCLSDLLLIDLATGEASPVASGVRPPWFALSPDRGSVLYTDFPGAMDPDDTSQALYDIVIADLRTGTRQTIAKNAPLYFPVTLSWSPDGRKIAYEEGSFRDKGCCRVFDLDRAVCEPVLEESDPRQPQLFRAPLWSKDSRSILLIRNREILRIGIGDRTVENLPLPPGCEAVDICSSREGREYWSPDGGLSVGALLLDQATGSTRLALIGPGTGDCRFLSDGAQDLSGSKVHGMDLTENRLQIAFTAQDVARPPDLWIYDFGTDTHRMATVTNPQLEGVEQVHSRLVEWFKADGTRLQGALLLPPGHSPSQAYPTIVAFHPALTPSRSINRYAVEGSRGVSFTNMQLLATRGYAVFMPDVPTEGATEMADIADAVLPGLDMLVEAGISDPDRLGVIGQSGGGYGVLALLVQTTRFKAAVASSSHCDYIAGASHLDGESFWMSLTANSMGGTLWERRDRYIDNSPIFFFDRVETPLMLICGSLDPTTPPHLTEQTYTCLRYLKKPVVYVRYEGEDHLPSHYSRANVADYTTRVLAWFDRYLKPSAG